VQAKLDIGQPGDAYEQEADRVAERVMTLPELTASGNENRLTKDDGYPDSRTIRLQSAKAVSGDMPALERQIRELGQGRTLDQETRAFMEARLAHDFGHVRIHTGASASDSAQALGAQAYTSDQDIVFATGSYNPVTFAGRKLLAHELAHVIQQSRSSGTPSVQRAETDTKGQCVGLKDGASKLNAYVNQQLDAIRAELTKGPAIEGESTGLLPTLPYQTALPAAQIVHKAFERLGAPEKVFLCPVESWANNHLDKRGGGFSVPLVSDVRKGTKYEYAPGILFNYLAPAVNLNGNCVGTDKIGHMFQQGYQYFIVSSDFKVRGGPSGEGKGDIYAKAWGEWMEGSLSEETKKNSSLMKWLKDTSAKKKLWITGYQQGYLGLTETGVHSRGDLAANEAGLKFYKALYANPHMTFDICNYITAEWDEEKSGNIYSKEIGEAVRKTGRLNPGDVVLPYSTLEKPIPE
jgi:hypothetical protein